MYKITSDKFESRLWKLNANFPIGKRPSLHLNNTHPNLLVTFLNKLFSSTNWVLSQYMLSDIV